MESDTVVVRIRLPKKYMEFLESLVRRGFASSKTDAVKFCIQKVMNDMGFIEKK